MDRIGFFREAILAAGIFAVLPCGLPAQEHAVEGTKAAPSAPGVSVLPAKSDSLARVDFPGQKSWGRVRKGAVLEGRLSLPLYAKENMVAPAESKIRVTVKSTEKIRERVGFWRKTGRAIVRGFNPLETSRPAEYRVELSAADMVLPTGEVLPLEARVLRANSGVIIGPKTKSAPSPGAAREKNKAAGTLLLAVRQDALSSIAAEPNAAPLSAGVNQHVVRAFLLTAMRASVNHEGDKFTAQLAEPMLVAGRVLASGSVVEGTVARSVAPRMLSRAGRLGLRVDRIVPHDGEPLPTSGSLSSAEADSQARFALDEEGTLHGRKPGIVNGLVDLGYAYAVGKVSDDISETPIRAIGASMSDAAVANAARYVGLGTAAVFLITRHGRDVYLPKYALLEIDFGRPRETAAANHD
jgi:hypothetical protein